MLTTNAVIVNDRALPTEVLEYQVSRRGTEEAVAAMIPPHTNA